MKFPSFGRLAGDEPRRSWRAIVDRLLADGGIAPGDYLKALAEGPGPARWAFALLVFFGAAQLIAGIIMFFAYNWRDLPDLAKIALPQAAMAVAFLIFAIAPGRSPLGAVAAIAATVMIGVSMGVVGQVYQLGADAWTLFAIWAGFALPLALVARSDALLAVAFLIASTAYFLYADENLRDRFAGEQAIPALYAALAFFVQLARDFLAAPIAGAQPRWQRWLFLVAALMPATSAGISEAMDEPSFANGWLGSVALLAISLATFVFYLLRPDRPARALALFATALWIGALGLRQIWRFDYDSAGAYSLGFIASALWVVALTAGLAVLLRAHPLRSAP